MHFAIRRLLATVTGLVAPIVLAGVASPHRAAAQQTPGDGPVRLDTAARPVGVLRPGDALKVLVFRNPELSGEYVIDSRGMVQIPGLGEIQAGGQDPTSVKSRLQTALMERGFSAPEVAVQPLVRVSVIGAVAKPSLYAVEPGPTLIQLLTLAGGPLESADLRRTRVIRDGRAFVVNLESALSGSGSGRVVLYSNDVVVVPKRGGLTRENLSFLFSTVTVLLSIMNVVLVTRR
jgi:protein involved in polysaccharide export with SLBB domain